MDVEDITIEEKKRLVKFIGCKMHGNSFHREHRPWCHLKNYTPELGGDDLTELLSKLSIPDYYKFLRKIEYKLEHEIGGTMIITRFFQDNKNAPTIVKAILEVIE